MTGADRPAASTDDGSADFAAGLAELGLTPKAGWYSSAVLYGVGGLLVTGLYVANPGLVPRAVLYLSCFAILVAALCLLAARLLGDGDASDTMMRRATHARLIIGLLIYVASVVLLGDRVVAFAMLPLLTLPTPCYLYSWRFALPYLVAPTAIVCVALLGVNGPARVAHALVSSCVFVVIGAAMIVTKQRTRRLAARSRRVAYTDALTGIANMRRLRERIAAELSRAGGERRAFALFAMDMDDFKQVNDRFDHSTGDRVLQAVANAISAELTLGDLAVRRGGDEFAVLVANPAARDLPDLRCRLERGIARARAAACPQLTAGGTVAYIHTAPGEELGAMMERADQALHDAKLASRRRRPATLPRAEAVATAAADTVGAGTAGADPAGGDARDAGIDLPPPARRRGFVARSLRRSHADWTFGALLLALGPLLTVPLSVAHVLEPLTPLAGFALGMTSVVLALGCLWAGGAGLSPRWLHVPWLVAYAILAVEIALAAAAGTALLDLIAAIVMYGFLVFRARSAVLYMLLGDALYGILAIAGGYSQAVGRTVITIVVVAVVGGLVAKLRLVTIRFTRRNRELSELDALTGVGNLRALRDRVADVVQRAPPSGCVRSSSRSTSMSSSPSTTSTATPRVTGCSSRSREPCRSTCAAMISWHDAAVTSSRWCSATPTRRTRRW